MYHHLYESFKHWFHDNKGQVLFYSDPHFGDTKSAEFRKTHNTYISDSEQLKRINSQIGKYDTIVFLGDIGDTDLIRKIKGYKVLILGNHDKGISNYRRDKVTVSTEDAIYTFYDNKLFDEVYEGCLTISDKIILSHEPIEFPYAINIHGHRHDLPQYYDSMHINVCAETIGYKPISLKQIVKRGFSKVKNIHDECVGRRK